MAKADSQVHGWMTVLRMPWSLTMAQRGDNMGNNVGKII